MRRELVSTNQIAKGCTPILVLIWLACAPLQGRRAIDENLASLRPISITVVSGVPRDAGVRAELAQMQARDGLTIAEYEHSLQIVDFEKRKAFRWEPFPSYLAGGGTMTRDGTQIAFQLSRSRQPSLILGIIKADNSNVREFSDVVSPGQMCWSNDMAHLAMGTVDVTTTTFRLTVLDIETNSVETLLHTSIDSLRSVGRLMVGKSPSNRAAMQ